jgi:hypothetical protein
MSLVKTKVSTAVSKQTPQFVREDHETFISFLEAYYEWLEQEYKTRELENIRDVDATLDEFIANFKNELLNQLPDFAITDKRYLAKVIQDVYRSKGTAKSYEFLFRAVFNETPTLYFPKVDLLRVSDGKYSQKSILRVAPKTILTGDPLNYLSQTIVQYDNNGNIISSARVENVVAEQSTSGLIYNLTLNADSIIGTFSPGIDVEGGSNSTSGPSVIISTVKTGVTSFQIIDGGTYSSVGDPVSVIAGVGTGATVEVAEVFNNGSVTEIIIDDPGKDYSVGQELIFNNTNTGGASSNPLVSARAVISEVTGTGGIKSVKLLSGGNFYTKLPIVSGPVLPPVVPPLTTGGAVLLASSNNIGKITKLQVSTFGLDYESPPICVPPLSVLLTDVSEFSIGEIIRGEPQTFSKEDLDELLLESGDRFLLESQQAPEGVLVAADTVRNLYKLFPVSDRFGYILEDGSGVLTTESGDQFVTEGSAKFLKNMTVKGYGTNGINPSGSQGKLSAISQAEIKGNISTVGITQGTFLNADGKISEASKRVQDSYFYQDFSYVIKVGQSIDKYRSIVRKLLHPIGLALFGEVAIQSVAPAKSQLFAGARIQLLAHVLASLINGKAKALGNYRTNGEQFNINKEQITLFLEDFVASILSLSVSTSEFLPTINFPNLTPAEVNLLDLRALTKQDVETIILQQLKLTKVQTKPSYYEKELDVNPDRTDATIKLGNRLNWLEKWKFTFAPYVAGSKGSIQVYKGDWVQPYPGLNNNYWTIGSTQIKDFGDITISDVINNPNRRVNLAFESFIDVVALPRGAITFDKITGGHSFDNNLAYRFDADSIELDNTAYSMDNNKIKFDNLT